MKHRIVFFWRAVVVCWVALVCVAGTDASKPKQEPIEPTFADVAYGPYERNKLDFWKAPSNTPTPLIVQIHGGGFYEGDKTHFRGRDAPNIARCLASGVSVASINYRFINAAPLQDILRDSARAIQFMRSNAESWNIDKSRVAAFGDSAGAGTSLWLAFHDDLAEPASDDPVRRESTRLLAAGALAPQATYDFAQWPEVLEIPNRVWWVSMWYVCPNYYHFNVLTDYLPKGIKTRADLDIRSLIDSNDPPVYLRCNLEYTRLDYTNLFRFLDFWANQKICEDNGIPKNIVKRDPTLNFDPLHHPNHTWALQKACESKNVPCTVVDCNTPAEKKIDVYDFLLERLAH